MGLGTILFPLVSQTYINDIRIDLVDDLTDSYQSTITQYPVEDGSTISDHIINAPFSLRIKGSITDTPIDLGNLDDIDGFTFQNQSGKSLSRDAYNSLFYLWANKIEFSILTIKRLYENLVFSSFQSRLDKSTGLAMDFSADCIQIIKATPKTIVVPAKKISETPANAKDQQQSSVDNGSQTTDNQDKLKETALLKIMQDFGYFK